MAGPSSPIAMTRPGPGAPLIARLDWLYGRLEEVLNLAAAVAIFALMIVGMWQILGRQLFDAPVYGYIDYIEQFSPLYGVLGLAYCQRVGGHIRMEVVLGQMRGRVLWLSEMIATILALFIVAILIDSTWANFMRAWTNGDSSMDIRLPIWPAKLIFPVALATLWLRLLLQLAGYFRLFADPSRLPIGVPVVETPELAARREIEDALSRTVKE